MAENLSARGLNLPTFPELKESEIAFISEVVKRSVDEIVGR